MTDKKNSAIAERLVYFDKTIAVLDQGGDYSQIIGTLQANGYYVYLVSDADLQSKTADRIGSILIIPDAEKFSPQNAEALERYRTCTGKVLFIGGPLFGKRNVSEKFAVVEGITPQYKVFLEKDCDNFVVLGDENISARPKTDKPVDVICPVMRPDGAGYNMERKVRLIPCVGVQKNGQRDGGMRGAAAYFVLSDTSGHLTPTWGSRPGTVTATTRGSIVGAVGISYDNLVKMTDGIKLVYDMIQKLDNGVFMFEAGADKYVCKPHENFKLGVKVLSAKFDYLEANVSIKVLDDTKIICEKQFPLLLNPQNYTYACESFEIDNVGDYTIISELSCGGVVTERIKSEIFVCEKQIDKTDEFIKVKDGDFYLKGEKWYMHGINYWPLYHVSLELTDYWLGAFDKSMYIPSEVDKDLAFLKEQHINSVAIRIENNDICRVVQPFKDFLYRCRKYGIKISLSFANITNPLHFQKYAYEKLMNMFEIESDSTLFALDLAWEVGSHFYDPNTKDKFLSHWKNWLEEQYGSIDDAQKYAGVLFDRDGAGNLVCPDCAGYFKDVDENERIQLTLFRYFIEDYASRIWNRCVREIKKLDSNHLIITRANCIYDDIPNGIIAHAQKHLDVIGLEGYSIELSAVGFAASVAQTEAAKFISNGKPVAWVEYGMSLVGASGYAFGTKIKWDKDNMSPFDYKIEEQRLYEEQFDKVMKYTGTNGSFPWFYAGGFRSTESSDAGYIAPNGVMRPCAVEYEKAYKSGLYGNPQYDERITLCVDVDNSAVGWPTILFGKGRYSKMNIDLLEGSGKSVDISRVDGPGLITAKKAYKENKGIKFVTTGTGTTSADTPLEACANVEYKGRGPLKYLNAEFNTVKVKTSCGEFEVFNGQTLPVESGETITFSVEVGNVAEAKWLAPCGEVKNSGDVFIKCLFQDNEYLYPILNDTDRFENTGASCTIKADKPGDIVLVTTAYNRADFGERFVIHIAGKSL